MEPDKPLHDDVAKLYTAWREASGSGSDAYDFDQLEKLLPLDLGERRAALYGLHKHMSRLNREIEIKNKALAQLAEKAGPNVVRMIMSDAVDTECMRLQNMIAETQRDIQLHAENRPQNECPKLGIQSSVADVKRIFSAMVDADILKDPTGKVESFVRHLFKESSHAKNLAENWNATEIEGKSRGKGLQRFIERLTDHLPLNAIDDLISYLQEKRAKIR